MKKIAVRSGPGSLLKWGNVAILKPHIYKAEAEDFSSY